MKRELSADNYKRFLKDFRFLFKHVERSYGELFLALRGSYFNLYYKGNSLAKVVFRRNDEYDITIHNKFITEEIKNMIEADLVVRTSKNYYTMKVSNEMKKYLRRILSKKRMGAICKNISIVNNGEEIAFEQILVADNMNRNDLFIIDRQVTEKGFGKKLDLLALKQVKYNKYKFMIIEVKLGNNPDLKGKVVTQLNNYVDRATHNWESWKQSYEECYRQLKKTVIKDFPEYDEIEIIKPVEGIIVVGGYKQVAISRIEDLLSKYKDLDIKRCWNEIEL